MQVLTHTNTHPSDRRYAITHQAHSHWYCHTGRSWFLSHWCHTPCHTDRSHSLSHWQLTLPVTLTGHNPYHTDITLSPVTLSLHVRASERSPLSGAFKNRAHSNHECRTKRPLNHRYLQEHAHSSEIAHSNEGCLGIKAPSKRKMSRTKAISRTKACRFVYWNQS